MARESVRGDGEGAWPHRTAAGVLRRIAESAGRRPDRVGLAGIIVAGIVLRSYRFGAPPYDAHAFRQTQTAATVWLWQRDGIDLLDYRVPVFGGGHWVLEFPGYQFLAYLLSPVVGGAESAARAISILAFVVSAVLVYAITLRVSGRTVAALAAAFAFSVFPATVFFFRAILIDGLAVALTLGGLWLALGFRDRPTIGRGVTIWFLLLVAALTKPTVVAVFLAPVAILYVKGLWERRRSRALWAITAIGAVVSSAALVGWAHHTDQLNALDNGLTLDEMKSWYFGTTFTDPHLFATLWERAFANIGWVGLILAVGGLVTACATPSKYRLELISLAASAPITVCIFANLNRIHEYYQLPYFVTIALFMGLGSAVLCDLGNAGGRALGRQVVATALGALAIFGVGDLFRGYFAENQVNLNFQSTGAVIRENTPARANVVVVGDGVDYFDSTLLYAARRTGWLVDKGRPEFLDRVVASKKAVDAVVVLKGQSGVPKWASDFAGRSNLRLRVDTPVTSVYRP